LWLLEKKMAKKLNNNLEIKTKKEIELQEWKLNKEIQKEEEEILRKLPKKQRLRYLFSAKTTINSKNVNIRNLLKGIKKK